MAAREDSEHIVARLRDYWGRRTPWQRRLWNPGSIAMLDEAVEATSLLQDGHLRAEGVKELAAAVGKSIGRDPGVGAGEVRKTLQDVLAAVHADSNAVRRLGYLRGMAADGYLDRWAEHLKTNYSGPAEVEFTSRALGAHLLDLGFSPEQLHRWVTAVSDGSGHPVDLFAAAVELAQRPTREFRVLVPIQAIPRRDQALPETWLDGSQMSGWLEANAPAAKLRQNGAMVYAIEARDAWAAVEFASDLFQSLSARIAVGLPGDNEFRTADIAFVEGSDRTYPMTRPRRQVDVHSLSRQGALFDTQRPGLQGRLRSALDLLASLETGAPGAAVAGGWAAIEALLARADSPNVQAAEEMATLIACSIARAELTTLSYQQMKDNPDHELSKALKQESSNRDRCVLLASAISDGSCPPFAGPSDRAACARIAEILAAPRKTLGRVQSYTEMAFRRLYRQRNMVLHAGKTDSVTILSTLRSAPPLVGAGIDRIVHAALQDHPVLAHDLVARASAELSLVGGPGGRHVADLLGA